MPFAAAPGYCGGGGIGSEFRCTEYPENYANMQRMVEILREANPKRSSSSPSHRCRWPPRGQASIMPSPTPKASARCEPSPAALTRKYEQVHYFHSYELVMHSQLHDVFMEDGRHVMPTYVAGIMQQFERAFVKPDSATIENSLKHAGAVKRRGPHFIDLSQRV